MNTMNEYNMKIVGNFYFSLAIFSQTRIRDEYSTPPSPERLTIAASNVHHLFPFELLIFSFFHSSKLLCI